MNEAARWITVRLAIPATLASAAVFGGLAGSALFAQGTSTAQLLRRMDANGNGQLEPGEIPSQSKLQISAIARRAGMDPNRALSISRLQEALVEAARSTNDRDDDGDNRGPRDRGGRDRGGREGGERGGAGVDRGSFGGPPPDRGGRESGGRDERERRERDRGRDNDDDEDRDRRNDRDRSDSRRGSTSTSTVTGGFSGSSSAAPVAGFDGRPLTGATGVGRLEDRYESWVLEMVDRTMLRRYDRNENGSLDADEIRNVDWSDDWKQDDKNGDGALTREELAERRVRQQGRGRKGSATSSGQMLAVTTSSSGPKPVNNQTREYAEGLIRRYDENKNGTLEPDEWKGMSRDPKAADTNLDGHITAEEMAIRLANYSSSEASGSAPSTTSPASPDAKKTKFRGWSNKQKTDEADPWKDRKSYRSASMAERLAKIMPDWFLKKDVDADGQVAMAEYTVAWTDQLLQEFNRFDVNGDGVIAPQEVIDSQKKTISSSAKKATVALGDKAAPVAGEKTDSPAAVGAKTDAPLADKAAPTAESPSATAEKSPPLSGDKVRPTFGDKTRPAYGDKTRPSYGEKTPSSGEKSRPGSGERDRERGNRNRSERRPEPR